MAQLQAPPAGTPLDFGSVFVVLVTIIVFSIPIFILFPPVPVERSDALRQTHSKLGVPCPNCSDGQVAASQRLVIHPIASCRGIELPDSDTRAGHEHDRLYVFAQRKPAGAEDAWELLTNGEAPRLASIKVDIWCPDTAKTSRLLGRVDGGFVTARFPWTATTGLRGIALRAAAKLSRGLRAVPEKDIMLPLELPSPADITVQGYQLVDVDVGKDASLALSMDLDLPPELALYLGVKHPLGLFRLLPASSEEQGMFPTGQSM
ncbi:hypothetical protein RJ55_06643 [Drechmeria coniospora]|nr:hypothetical protein RJ55_06643 [Drechmeria coniospora]